MPDKRQIEKLGNTMVYLADNTSKLSKTKLLKLLYILDEISIKKYGFPFLNLSYEVWQFGPVEPNLYVSLSEDDLGKLANYISIHNANIQAKTKFDDEQFSDNDMNILKHVADNFGKWTANDLVNFVHNKNSLWYKTSQKHGLLEDFEEKNRTTSNYTINFEELFEDKKDDVRLHLYKEYKEFKKFTSRLQ